MNITGASIATSFITTNNIAAENSSTQILVKSIAGTYTILTTIPAVPRPGTGQVYPRYA